LIQSITNTKYVKSGTNVTISSTFFCLSLIAISLTNRSDFWELMVLIAVAFIAYFLLVNSNATEKQKWQLSILFYGSCLFFTPNLSNDIYRFIWDGELLQLGINPYDFKPNELIQHSRIYDKVYLREIYALIDPLSQENYSCYPIVNQVYFYLSALVTSTIAGNIFVLKLLMLLSLFSGYYFLDKLLVSEGFDRKIKWFFVLNPLVLVEGIQNVHFEGVVVAWLVIGFYLLSKHKLILGALCFGIAIQLKLLPIIVLPFLLRWLGWKKSMLTWSIVGVFVVLTSFILLDNENIQHFFQSLRLYFRVFEFNSFILHWYIEYGINRYGYNRIQTFAPYLARIATEIIIVLAWYGNYFTLKTVFTRLFLAFTCYYLLSSTVHPWYLIVPLFFGIFTNYFVLYWWSFLVFLSYYSYVSTTETNLRVIQGFEYGLVIPMFLLESIHILRKRYTTIR
jgi:alpha-1,6-mannosyltransferase